MGNYSNEKKSCARIMINRMIHALRQAGGMSVRVYILKDDIMSKRCNNEIWEFKALPEYIYLSGPTYNYIDKSHTMIQYQWFNCLKYRVFYSIALYASSRICSLKRNFLCSIHPKYRAILVEILELFYFPFKFKIFKLSDFQFSGRTG